RLGAIDGRSPLRADDRLQHSQGDALRQALRHVGDEPRSALQRHSHQLALAQPDRPFRRKEPGERPKQRGLARRIRADQRHDLTRSERRKRQAVDDPPVAIAGGYTLDRQAFGVALGHTRSGRRRISSRNTGTPIIDVTMPTGSRAPGTSILLTTEASDITSAPVSIEAGSRKR